MKKSALLLFGVSLSIITACSNITDYAPNSSFAPDKHVQKIDTTNPFLEYVTGERNSGENSKNDQPLNDANTDYSFWPDEPVFGLEKVTIDRTIDGDTVLLTDGRRVRFTGIDAPEMNVNKELPPEDHAQNATDYVDSIVFNHSVFLETNPEHMYDPYDRVLGYLWIDMADDKQLTMLNAMLLQEGLAEVMTMPPNTTYAHLLGDIQEQAISNSSDKWK